MILTAALAFFGAVGTAVEDTRPNPYSEIAERNPFGLRPPPPAQPDQSAVVENRMVAVEVTGITSMLRTKKAFLEIVPAPGKTVIKPMLSEGERLESVEVISIDMDKSVVTINNGGIITNISLRSPASTLMLARGRAEDHLPNITARGSVVAVGGN